MPNLAMERRHLAIADRSLAQGERRLDRQAALVEALRRRGAASPEAEALLTAFRDTLAVWREHRRIIVRTIHELEA